MTDYYYSTQPFLAWCLNHYFYNQKHFAYIAKPFHTYRFPNPKSSNPYLIYQDLYMPWQDRDDYDKYISQTRLNLRLGVEKRYKAGIIDVVLKKDLNDICDKVDILFLYPIVYRVDLALKAVKSRIKSTDWRLRGSNEHMIEDLQESPKEFDLLFLDFDADPEFNQLKGNSLSGSQALIILKRRC